MSIRFKQLLQDCKDSLEWITEREEWNARWRKPKQLLLRGF